MEFRTKGKTAKQENNCQLNMRTFGQCGLILAACGGIECLFEREVGDVVESLANSKRKLKEEKS